jgi:hypothetical protein
MPQKELPLRIGRQSRIENRLPRDFAGAYDIPGGMGAGEKPGLLQTAPVGGGCRVKQAKHLPSRAHTDAGRTIAKRSRVKPR